MAFSLQTSIYMDYLSVEEQIVQTLYQQVQSQPCSDFDFIHRGRACTPERTMRELLCSG